MAIDPGAQRVLDLIRESGRPPYETLTVPEAREVSRNARAVTQPASAAADRRGVPVTGGRCGWDLIT